MRNSSVSKSGKLTFREKLSRLGRRLGEKRWRRYGMLMLAGRALGLVVLLTLILGGPMLFHAASDPTRRIRANHRRSCHNTVDDESRGLTPYFPNLLRRD